MADEAGPTFSLNRDTLRAYLERVFGEPVKVNGLKALGERVAGEREPAKSYGYGQPVCIDLEVAGAKRSVVLHTMKPSPFGHQHMADRAAIMLWSHKTFNHLPRHVKSLDVGGFTADDQLSSLGDLSEVFLLTDYVPGEPYARDLARLAERDELTQRDLDRADAICDYLVQIHRQPGPDPTLYTRRIRELVGHGECIMGLIDSYPGDFALMPASRLESLEKQVVHWRWRLKERTHRLRQVHGDLHQWNLLFHRETEFYLLDRSRGEWGEPADDVTSLTLNYLFESLMAHNRYGGALAGLFQRFWHRYLEQTGDRELLEVCAPFVAFRGLVMASPVWYPHISGSVRRQLLNLVESVLEEPVFDPDRIEEYCCDT